MTFTYLTDKLTDANGADTTLQLVRIGEIGDYYHILVDEEGGPRLSPEDRRELGKALLATVPAENASAEEIAPLSLGAFDIDDRVLLVQDHNPDHGNNPALGSLGTIVGLRSDGWDYSVKFDSQPLTSFRVKADEIAALPEPTVGARVIVRDGMEWDGQLGTIVAAPLATDPWWSVDVDNGFVGALYDREEFEVISVPDAATEVDSRKDIEVWVDRAKDAVMASPDKDLSQALILLTTGLALDPSLDAVTKALVGR